MVNNWNNAVNKDDIVYFLGDWGFGRGSRPSTYWIKLLNGKIISIRGSHDHRQGGQTIFRHQILKTDKHTFLLIHDPNDKRTWQGWTIHGHIHNSKMDKYPFINGIRKTINVSVELTGYAPISLDYLESLDIDSIRWMRTSKSTPERN
jgi:calcineurin-like phosphoesterase family protein